MKYFPVNYLPGAGPLGGEEEAPQVQGIDKTFVESTLDVHEAANPGSRDETLGKIDSEGLFIEAQAKAEVAAGLPNPSKIIDDGILNQQDPEAVRLSLEGLISKQDALSKVHPNLEAALLASLEESETMDINYVSNRDMMEKMLRKAYVEAGNDDVGILRTGFDFIDYHIFGMVGRTYEDLTNRTARLGFTLNDIAKLPPDEAKEKMQLYIEEINKEGAFNNNSFAWDQALREFNSMGYNPEADTEFAWGVVDVATSGTLSLASKTGRAAARRLIEQKILRNPLGRYNKVANMKGPEEAGKLVKAAAEKGDPDAIVQGGTSLINLGSIPKRVVISGPTNPVQTITPSTPANTVAGPTGPLPVNSRTMQTPVPPAVASVGIRNNEILQIVEDTIKKRSAGTMFSEDDVLRITDEVKQSWAARASSPVFDIKPMDLPFHELGFAIKIGDKFGNPFFDESLAQKGAQALSRDIQARVTPVPVDELDPSKGYVLQLEHRVANSAAKAEFELNPVSAVRRLMGSIFGSSASMDVVEEMAKGASLAKVDNYANAIRGQDAATKINKEVGNKLKFIKSIDKDSLFAIGEVFRDLRDGIDASRKDAYSISEFEAKFAMFHPQRRLPTERETEAYMNILDLEEAAWMVKASTKLNKFLEAGMESITFNGQKMVGKKVDFNSVPKDAGILDASGNVVRKINTTVGNTPFKTDAIFQLMDPLTNGITYIRNPEVVKPLTHKDVLPFNAGGRRTYSDGRYFVVFKNADGTPAAKLTALTQKQADTAGKQLNAILDAEKTGHPDLDAVVRSNNDWDPSVKSYQDFQKWLADNNVIGDGKFTWKTDGGVLDDTDWAAGAAKVPGLTWQEKVAGSASRQDKPLAKFGGGKAHVEDPLTSIGETFASATNQLTNTVAINKGVNAWVKALRASPSSGWTVPQEIQNSGDAFSIFRSAQPTNQLTEEGRRLKEIRDIINRRHGIARSQNLEDVVQQWLNNYAENILDSKLSDLSVFDKKPIKWLGSRIVDMGNPANNLLKLGFGANFGFFALDQLLVQASHGLILGPIIAWDQRALRAMMGTNAVRVALAARGTPTGDMAVERLAKYLGEDVATTKKFIEYIEISGRSIVGTEAIEMGWAGSSVLNRKAGQSAPTAFEKGVEASKQAASSFFDKSLWAYKLGEHSSRLSTMSAAFFKYRKEFPLGDPLSEEGLSWITRKEQAYAFHMTNAGRSRWQEGLMRFPTQWLAYGMRSMEAVFIGRDLTTAERARASLAMFAFFGTNGAALGWAHDWMAEKLGIEPGGDLYQAIKYGVLDAGLSALGVDVAISDRIAPIKGIVDTFQNVAEDSAVETLAGPSASIVGGGIRSLSSAFNNIIEGNIPLTVQDLNSALRTIRSYDNMSKAWGIYKYGFIMSKTGMKYEAEYDALDAVMQGMGISPREVSLLNQKRSEKFKTDQEMRDLRKKYNGYMSIALAKIGSDLEFERQKGYELMHSIAVSIQALEGLSPSERYSLQRGLFLDKKDLVEEIYTNEVKREKAYSAEAFRRIMKGD